MQFIAEAFASHICSISKSSFLINTSNNSDITYYNFFNNPYISDSDTKKMISHIH
jgi:hypothetical protein